MRCVGFDYDAELRYLYPPFRAALGIEPGDRVLDVGCGTGQTARDAARVAVDGHVLGVDVSAVRLAEARELAAATGLHNVAFELADAQVHPFPEAEFDLVMSRFGTMFFADPLAAFANLARATQPGGRLVMLVWRERELDEWSGPLIDAILDGADGAPLDDSPFSLADADSTRALLERAGYRHVQFAEVAGPVWYGADVSAAFDALMQLNDPREALGRFTGDDLVRARERLRSQLAAHTTTEGVLFGSRAWIITAGCP